MYGFGDDRNPANDSVNVMEEILIEYIVDVVSILSPLSHYTESDQQPLSSVKQQLDPARKLVCQ